MSKIKIFGMGGLDENGKNTYVVEVNNKIFVFDAGLKYATDNIFGIDYIIPDYSYLIDNKDRIEGVFITHAHPESYGGVSDLIRLIPSIKIYAILVDFLILLFFALLILPSLSLVFSCIYLHSFLFLNQM